MDGLQVLETLTKINPWHRTGKVPDAQLEFFRRREFIYLKEDISKLEMATLVIGGRRVGKSVLMYQLIDNLLQAGVSDENILFVQGDNPILTEYLKDGRFLNVIFEIYQKYIIKKNFQDLDEPLYIFIDEAQNIPNWEIEIKALIDLRYKIKFMITGSSSRELRQGAQNPLTGRVNVFALSPFSFSDFAKYNLPLTQQVRFGEAIEEQSLKFSKALTEGNIIEAYSVVEKVIPMITPFGLREKLDDYLYTGGFPWVISHKNGDDIHKYLRDLLTTTISKDILTQVEIRDTQAFERLMVNLCLFAGSVVKFKNIADVLGLEERTVVKYIDYYVDSHWAFISSPYAFHRRADSVKTGKKIYVIDTGVINTLAFKDQDDLKNDRQYKGKVLENAIHNHLLTLRQRIIGTFQNYIPYWLEEGTSREIDFIFEIKNGVVPIEAKCKTNITPDDTEALEFFLKERSSAKFAIITTEDILEIRGNILLMPYSVLLLLL